MVGTMNNKDQRDEQDPLDRALEEMRAIHADTSYKKTWAERMKESGERLDASMASLEEAMKKIRD